MLAYGLDGTIRGLPGLLVRYDLQLSTQVKSPHTDRPTIFLWKSVPGGFGFRRPPPPCALGRELTDLLPLD